jgi:hypothetical protein
MRISMRLVAALAACGGLWTSAASAAVITWQAPVPITDEADLDAPLNQGYPTIVQAVSYGDAEAVVTPARTITFVFGNQADGSPPVGGDNDTVYSFDGGTEVNTGLFDPTGTTVGAAFESVLDSQA